MPTALLAELIVAGIAAAIYSWSASTLWRVVARRRRQRARRDSRFVAGLLAGVENGEVRSLPDAASLFRTHFSLPDRDEISYFQLRSLIWRAEFRHMRREMSQARSSNPSSEKFSETRSVLRQLREQIAPLSFDDQSRRLSAAQKERIRPYIEAMIDRRDLEALDPRMSLWNPETQRRMADWGRPAFTGAGGLGFIWLALATWNVWM